MAPLGLGLYWCVLPTYLSWRHRIWPSADKSVKAYRPSAKYSSLGLQPTTTCLPWGSVLLHSIQGQMEEVQAVKCVFTSPLPLVCYHFVFTRQKCNKLLCYFQSHGRHTEFIFSKTTIVRIFYTWKRSKCWSHCLSPPPPTSLTIVDWNQAFCL